MDLTHQANKQIGFTLGNKQISLTRINKQITLTLSYK